MKGATTCPVGVDAASRAEVDCDGGKVYDRERRSGHWSEPFAGRVRESSLDLTQIAGDKMGGECPLRR